MNDAEGQGWPAELEPVLASARHASEVAVGEEIRRVKSRKQFFAALEQNTDLADIVAHYRAGRTEPPGMKERPRRAREAGRAAKALPHLASGAFMGASRSALWGLRDLPFTVYEPSADRPYCLRFNGGSGSGDLRFVEVVTDIENGRVGWVDQLWIDNNDTDSTIQSGLFLGWSRRIPEDGSYRYRIAAPETLVNVDYDLDGSGLWGLDASLRVEHLALFGTHGPSGTRLVLNEHHLVLYADRSSFFGSGQTLGTGQGWFPVGTTGSFYAYRDEWVFLALNLMFWTWAENGYARFAVADFWYPSVDPDSEICIYRSQ